MLREDALRGHSIRTGRRAPEDIPPMADLDEVTISIPADPVIAHERKHPERGLRPQEKGFISDSIGRASVKLE